jgi:hypothetical protein
MMVRGGCGSVWRLWLMCEACHSDTAVGLGDALLSLRCIVTTTAGALYNHAAKP